MRGSNNEKVACSETMPFPHKCSYHKLIKVIQRQIDESPITQEAMVETNQELGKMGFRILSKRATKIPHLTDIIRKMPPLASQIGSTVCLTINECNTNHINI